MKLTRETDTLNLEQQFSQFLKLKKSLPWKWVYLQGRPTKRWQWANMRLRFPFYHICVYQNWKWATDEIKGVKNNISTTTTPDRSSTWLKQEINFIFFVTLTPQSYLHFYKSHFLCFILVANCDRLAFPSNMLLKVLKDITVPYTSWRFSRAAML